MKAMIKRVGEIIMQIEGTPREISEILDLTKDLTNFKPKKKLLFDDFALTDWFEDKYPNKTQAKKKTRTRKRIPTKDGGKR